MTHALLAVALLGLAGCGPKPQGPTRPEFGNGLTTADAHAWRAKDSAGVVYKLVPVDQPCEGKERK